jgi:hypothetical protein
METTAIIISGTPEDIAEGLRRFVKKLPATEPKPEPELSDRMSRRQAAKFMQVSYQTMYNYTKAGIIKEHGTTGKKFYLRNELIEVIKNNS